MLGIELLAFAVILLAIPGAVIAISSALRKTSPRAGFVALGWAILIYWISAFVGAYVGGSSANGVFWLVGTVLTAIVVARDGYRWGLSWLWLILPGIGWWLLLWARNNQLDRRREQLAEVRPAGASAGPA